MGRAQYGQSILIFILYFDNSVYPDQLASNEAGWSGYTLFFTHPVRGSRKFCQSGFNSDNVFLVDTTKGATTGPPAKSHLNGVSLAGP